MVETAQGALAVLAVRVGDHSVLAGDEHRPDLLARPLEGLNLRDAVLALDLFAVKRLEPGLADRIGGWLETRIVRWNRSRVPGALDVVLSPHRIDAGALAPQVAGHQRQVAETLDIVDAADVFGDAEGVVDPGFVGAAVPQRSRLDVGCRHPRDRLRPLRRELLHVLEEVLGAGGALGDEPLVHHALPGDDVGHPQ